MKKAYSLRRQFLLRILIALLVVVLISSIVQLFFIKKQIDNNIENQANLVAHNVIEGINETVLASKSIEHQIDLKMVGYAKNISLQLKGKSGNEITSKELIKARDELGLQGITILQQRSDDVVGTMSTDSKEIGFSFKSFGDQALLPMIDMLNGKVPRDSSHASYVEKGLAVIPISQSGSHQNKPVFIKYAYYHPPGTDYIINPYIEENQVYKFTQAVGPDYQISNVLKTNHNVNEIAVLNPEVFKKPSLEKNLFNPKKKVEYGTFNLKNQKNIDLVKKLASNPHVETMVEKINGKKLYQMFIPEKDGRVIYIAFDYQKMSKPLYRHSIILIATGLLSLIILFLLTVRFFSRIYENIQKIKDQISKLETGDLTATSEVRDGSELESLSNSANKMAQHLNMLMKETQNHALKTQTLSVLLEKEASESVDKMYQVSAETTIKSREQLYEITEFINEVEQVLEPFKEQEAVQSVLGKIDRMKEVANDHTSTTTDMTITLADLLKSLYGQSSELSDISNTLLHHMEKFKL